MGLEVPQIGDASSSAGELEDGCGDYALGCGQCSLACAPPRRGLASPPCLRANCRLLILLSSPCKLYGRKGVEKPVRGRDPPPLPTGFQGAVMRPPRPFLCLPETPF